VKKVVQVFFVGWGVYGDGVNEGRKRGGGGEWGFEVLKLAEVILVRKQALGGCLIARLLFVSFLPVCYVYVYILNPEPI
jgi:hypothetical protein